VDGLGLIVLRREIAADCEVASDAANLAGKRLAERRASDLEATAFQLVRFYNAVEQAGLRLAKAFENQIDDEGGWHAELMRRLTLDIPGIRPAVFTTDDLVFLRELRGFRHLVVHAYDLLLNADRVGKLAADAKQISEFIPVRFGAFFDAVMPAFPPEGEGQRSN